ncbi:MAG: sigma-54-dependent Fis family transcriptional regulator [Thiotrichales bacterium]|nr:MAG: sigma-54-dependent Fis family transcriptional regulator [Thiotrichales bacterium]
MNSVLIVDDEAGIRSFLQKGLGSRFGLIEVAEDVDTANELRKRCHFDLIIADIRLPGRSGVEWVTELREQGSMTAVIFITAYADVETAISALRAGAADFIMKPFRMEQIHASVERCLEKQKYQRENYLLRREVENYYDSAGMVGNCELMQSVCQVIKRVAPMSSTVLISGETGTGKELAGRAIHIWSGRAGSFVPINCGAMSAELLESELFGHARGAFTGAHQNREGLFKYANGGTLFLDEIGEMPLSMQTNLLRVMEQHTIRPVGSNKEVPVDVRVVAATNRDLYEEVRKGNFREDLFYRLDVLSIRMPSLKERLEDLPDLVKHFSTMLAGDMGVPAPQFDENELNLLESYAWPGNIRELKNVIERSLLLNRRPSQCVADPDSIARNVTGAGQSGLTLEEIEKRHILKVLNEADGNKSSAARTLGISRKTLDRKTKSWNSS